MLRTLVAGFVVGVALVAPATVAADIEPGKPAPVLDHVNWLKGEPISQWEKGQVYVVDFWATWCGPCVASIPHVNQLQKDYTDKGVHVIGVAIWPSATMTPTKEFVDKRADGMDYTVAEDVDGKTADAFMTAAGRNSIPTVFVIDKDGNVAWIGHPMDGLDDIVDLVVKGEYGPEAEAKRQEQIAKKREQLNSLAGRLQSSYMASNWEEVAKVCDEMLALDPKMLSAAAVYKYVALAKLGGDEKPSKARVWGTQVISTLYEDDPESLQALAMFIVGPETELQGDEVDSELAVTAAEKAVQLTNHEDINALDTLARAYFVNGDTQKAADTEGAAIVLLEKEMEKLVGQDDVLTQYQAVKDTLVSRKAEYESATKPADGG